MGAALQVYTAECPRHRDGRLMHYFKKVGGKFVCCNCGDSPDGRG